MENVYIEGFPLSAQDHLFVEASSSVSSTIVRLEVIAQLQNGQDYQATLLVSPDAIGNLAITSQRATKSVITSMIAHIDSGAPELGQCFVRAGILRGGSTIAFSTANLISGYLPVSGQITWPGRKKIHPSEGRGAIVQLDITNPAAGADWVHTVPDRHIIRPLALNYLLTADATVISRLSQLRLRDPSADVIALTQPTLVQTASTVITYSSSINPFILNSIGNAADYVPMPEIRLPQGFDLGTATQNLQAADQYSAISFTFEEWLLPS